ncbi:hypothetical protein [Azospirillum sp. SYSU D00513]|uniref:hypothetical protein n=1 Tax=Azospirillum sp. SYSU D00513 TaxID=2812561 RepID=UPI001A97923F|nr:hypothetical protein [Azospirillum sp. SYSU D00513]
MEISALTIVTNWTDLLLGLTLIAVFAGLRVLGSLPRTTAPEQPAAAHPANSSGYTTASAA